MGPGMPKEVPAGSSSYTAETSKPFVPNVYCGAEVVENRYGDASKVSGPGRIADDVLQAACIVGTEIKDWQKLDFADVKGRSLFEDKEIGAGPGTNVMGGAMISLAWLANKLLANGKGLQACDVIREPPELPLSTGRRGIGSKRYRLFSVSERGARRHRLTVRGGSSIA